MNISHEFSEAIRWDKLLGTQITIR